MSDTEYNVSCIRCGSVWVPSPRTPLWWKAKKRADEGYLNAICVSPIECGCEQPVSFPACRYRVVGYDDMCIPFDFPFDSLVEAARTYLQIAREGMSVVVFVDKTVSSQNDSTRVQQRLRELEWA